MHQSRTISVPCGVFVFLNVSIARLSASPCDFRPLRGLRVSQLWTGYVTRDGRIETYFRPLRGLRVSQC